MAQPEVGAYRVGLASALVVAALPFVGDGLAQVGRVEAGAGEVGRVGRWCRGILLGECLTEGVSMNTGSTTQMPAAKSGPRSWTYAQRPVRARSSSA